MKNNISIDNVMRNVFLKYSLIIFYSYGIFTYTMNIIYLPNFKGYLGVTYFAENGHKTKFILFSLLFFYIFKKLKIGDNGHRNLL